MSMRRVEPRMSKEVAMMQWMDAMLTLQKAQVDYTFMVAKAVSRMDKSKEILPFSMASQHFDVLRNQIDRVDAFADKWQKGH
tara:strand:- start:1664 stop:1909 length:246 start_codon:yes stop_codon:yes gene_type:complete